MLWENKKHLVRIGKAGDRDNEAVFTDDDSQTSSSEPFTDLPTMGIPLPSHNLLSLLPEAYAILFLSFPRTYAAHTGLDPKILLRYYPQRTTRWSLKVGRFQRKLTIGAGGERPGGGSTDLVPLASVGTPIPFLKVGTYYYDWSTQLVVRVKDTAPNATNYNWSKIGLQLCRSRRISVVLFCGFASRTDLFCHIFQNNKNSSSGYHHQ
jgi:hypothetical protein